MQDRNDRQDEDAHGIVQANAGAGHPRWGARHRVHLHVIRRRAGHLSLALVIGLVVLAGASAIVLWALLGRTVALPVWVVAEVETRANATIAAALPEAGIAIGRIDVTLEEGWTPNLRLGDVRLLQGQGSTLLLLPEVRVAFDISSFVEERVLRPRTLRILGANLDMRRNADGAFNLRFLGRADTPQVQGMDELLGALDRVFAHPSLSRLEFVEAQGTSLRLEDARTGRVWEMGDGRIRLDNRPESLAAQVGFSIAGNAGSPAQALATAVRGKGEALVRLSATIENIAARDLAIQAPVLAWLSVLDAPLSGKIRAELTPSGLQGMEAELAIGSGDLQPSATARPVPFDKAGLRLAYDPARGRLALSEFSVESPSLRLLASGTSYPLDRDGRIMTGALGSAIPTAFLGQVSVKRAQIDPEGLFQRPLTFTQGGIDARLTLDPFRLEIGQMSLIEDGGRRLSLNGSAEVAPLGWDVSLDLGLDAIAHDRLFQLWPVSLVPRTREWLGENVTEGLLQNVRAALRLSPGKEPKVYIGYEFEDAGVRFLKGLPPIRYGKGRSYLDGKTYVIALDAGQIEAPAGGAIDVRGSVFKVPDVTRKPAMGDIRLKTRSTITAALALLDLPPLQLMTKADQPIDLAQGTAVLDTQLSVPLIPKVNLPDISYEVRGDLLGVRTDRLAKGRLILADRLEVVADKTGIGITGPGEIDGVPFTATYRQDFTPGERTPASVSANLAISSDVLDRFGIGLPANLVSGSGRASVNIELPRGAPARLSLDSDLRDVGLSLAPLSWTKPRDGSGRLSVKALLSDPPVVERIEIESPGLRALGTVRLRGKGELELARFDEVEVQDWFSGAVEFRGQGAGKAPVMAVTSGQIDLRGLDLLPATAGNGGAEPGPIIAQLDRVIVSQGQSLIGFQGEFTRRGGFNGAFTGSLNGGALVRGTVVPSRSGSAVQLTSSDAGAALRAAGVFSNASGGTLQMTIAPRGSADGHYDAEVQMRNLRVRKTNVLAELMSAVSIVGLLEQLNGSGILFGTADFDLVITPNAVEITRGSAVGATLGVSIAGVYGTRTQRMDMQGVISPVYLVNGIGAALTRRGEGLFGFNYRLRGASDNPQVQVNPLSILTPGMFRDIFRRPAPGLNQNREGQGG